MFRYVAIELVTFHCMTRFVLCSVIVASKGLVLPSSSLKPLDSKGIISQSSIHPSVTSNLPSLFNDLSSPPSSFRSSIPSLHNLPNYHPIPLRPVISPNQPHLSARISSGFRSKLTSIIPFWHKKQTPNADKRALNLVRFSHQYRRGLPNAMALYNAILESHERRWMLDDPSLMHHFPPGHPESMRMIASNRKVGKVVNRIMSNFLADCVGVIISEIFRKMGEVAGEVARLIVSNSAEHVLGKEDSSSRSSSSSSPVKRIIEAIKPKKAISETKS